jgi:superfamily II DNA/RNA helicase
MICQVLARGTSMDTHSQAKNLRDNPPHILIATPKALHDLYLEDPEALQLTTLSTVVVDDADYLIPSSPKGLKEHALRKLDR